MGTNTKLHTPTLPSKQDGLRYLMKKQANVPPTLFDVQENHTAVQEALHAFDGSVSDWIIRVDAPPQYRFSLKGARADHASLLTKIDAVLADNAHVGMPYKLFCQACIPSAVEGLAIQLTEHIILVEIQREPGGHFVRDGSVPYRWVLDTKETGRASIRAPLTEALVEQIIEQLSQLEPNHCLEWVFSSDRSQLYCIDAKPMPDTFLQDAATRLERGADVAFLPLFCGEAEGVLLTTSDEEQELRETHPHLLLIEAPNVSDLARLHENTCMVLFKDGGLLSHFSTYAASYHLPMAFIGDSTYSELGTLRKKQVHVSIHPDHFWYDEGTNGVNL